MSKLGGGNAQETAQPNTQQSANKQAPPKPALKPIPLMTSRAEQAGALGEYIPAAEGINPELGVLSLKGADGRTIYIVPDTLSQPAPADGRPPALIAPETPVVFYGSELSNAPPATVERAAQLLKMRADNMGVSLEDSDPLIGATATVIPVTEANIKTNRLSSYEETKAILPDCDVVIQFTSQQGGRQSEIFGAIQEKPIAEAGISVSLTRHVLPMPDPRTGHYDQLVLLVVINYATLPYMSSALMLHVGAVINQISSYLNKIACDRAMATDWGELLALFPPTPTHGMTATQAEEQVRKDVASLVKRFQSEAPLAPYAIQIAPVGTDLSLLRYDGLRAANGAGVFTSAGYMPVCMHPNSQGKIIPGLPTPGQMAAWLKVKKKSGVDGIIQKLSAIWLMPPVPPAQNGTNAQRQAMANIAQITYELGDLAGLQFSVLQVVERYEMNPSVIAAMPVPRINTDALMGGNTRNMGMSLYTTSAPIQAQYGHPYVSNRGYGY